ncbi:MAG TPA: hypothetical protein VGK54_11795, partial [Chloroflexota bacterium]
MATGTKRNVSYHDLRGYLDLLDEAGLLKHISAPVDPMHEIGAIAALGIDRKQPALFFENVKG